MTFRRALIAVAAGAIALCWIGSAFAASTNVVVSEFRFRGPVGGNDEFIELYNLSSAPVDISGWKLNGSNNAGTTSTRATIPAGTILAAGCHYLLTNSTASTGYSGAVPGDATFATGVTDDGGVAVLLPANAIVDMAGLSAGSAYKEGTPLASLGSTNADRSYERKPGGTAGNGADTDNNASDFQLITPSAPQNMLSSCVGTAPTPTNPSGTGTATPGSVAQGALTLLTVATTPGTNPASSGLTVTADLTQIGGAAAASFHDDGLAGDATAGDGTYSFQATVDAATTTGSKSLPFTVADAQSRSGTGSISLTVTASGGGGTPSLTGLVVSQLYGGGGNAGSTLTNDYIEIFNPTSSPVDLSSASVQYAAATGTGAWQVTNLTGTIQPHRYYLVQEAQGTGGTTALPPPDATGTIAMAAGAGKVALVASQTALNGACPTGPVDLVGFGTTANCSETAPAPAPSASTADLRANGGCTDTGNNAADFTAGTPAPRNSASPANTCTGLASPTITCGSDLTTPQGTAVTGHISATDSDGVVTSLTLVNVTPAPAQGSISLANVVPATANGGTATADLVADDQLPVGSYTVQLQAANDDPTPQTATCSLHVNVTGTLTIGAVQGSVPDSADGKTFASPYVGQTVTVRGVVTQLALDGTTHGFFVQNSGATADSDPLSSDGIFVFTSTFPDTVNHYTPVVGDEIVLTGRVNEFFNQTELGSASATKVGAGTVTPFVTDPPSDSADAARYWERHEGMQATLPTGSIVDTPRHFYASTADTEFYAIAPTTPVALRADPYARRAFRDAHPLDDQPGTFDNGNGFRILVTDEGIKVGNPTGLLPPVHTFQTFTAPATGGVYFAFGKYSVSVSSQPQVADGVDPALNDPPQTFDRSQSYSISNFNMDNLYDYRDDPFDGCDFFGNSGCPGVSPPFDYPPSDDAEYQQRETEIAHQIVDDLHSPDVIVTAEAEDQDICTVQNWALVCGTTNNADGKPDTLQELTVHIHALGGPAYDVANDRDGTDARGIICAFLYRTDRVQLLPASATDAVLGSSPAVSYRGTPLAYDNDVSNPKALNAVLPGDVDVSTGHDGSNVFTRAAQVAHFRISPVGVPGTPSDIWLIGNHFSSGPDSQVGQRREQAAYNAALVRAIQSQDPQAKVMVIGDLNQYPRPDDPFPPPNTSDQLAPLYDAGLHDLYDKVIDEHPSAAYSYTFEGQAQDLDHQFVTDSFFSGLQAVNEAHINSDFPLDVPGDNRGTSDHDPMVSRWPLAVDRAPTVSAGGPYSVDEGGTTTLTASGSDPDGDTLTYAWDLNGDGTFETEGQSVPYAAGDGPATPTVTVRATDPSGLSSTSSATVTIRNVAPTATFVAPATATVGTGFTLALTSPHDASAADTSAGFTYAFDCGDGSGYGAFGSAASRACPAPAATGSRTVRGTIRDRDGGATEYTRTVTVGVTYDAICKLARSYSSKKLVADLVCAELAIAEAYDTRGQAHAAATAVKVAEVTVKVESGRAFTRDEANTLIALMEQL